MTSFKKLFTLIHTGSLASSRMKSIMWMQLRRVLRFNSKCYLYMFECITTPNDNHCSYYRRLLKNFRSPKKFFVVAECAICKNSSVEHIWEEMNLTSSLGPQLNCSCSHYAASSHPRTKYECVFDDWWANIKIPCDRREILFERKRAALNTKGCNLVRIACMRTKLKTSS